MLQQYCMIWKGLCVEGSVWKCLDFRNSQSTNFYYVPSIFQSCFEIMFTKLFSLHNNFHSICLGNNFQDQRAKKAGFTSKWTKPAWDLATENDMFFTLFLLVFHIFSHCLLLSFYVFLQRKGGQASSFAFATPNMTLYSVGKSNKSPHKTGTKTKLLKREFLFCLLQFSTGRVSQMFNILQKGTPNDFIDCEAQWSF